MFGSLKKKLSSAIQEGIVISENLQQQYRQRVNNSSNQPSPTSSDWNSTSSFSLSGSELADGVPTNLNVATGCSLLAKYEDDWQKIHCLNEENAAKAAAVATAITTVAQRANAQRVNIADLNSILTGIPALVEKLKASAETLKALEQTGALIEDELEKLEDLCEECELQEFMLQKQLELSLHKQKKMDELEVKMKLNRQQIAQQHQANLRAHEQRLRQIQSERQAVFEDAFRGDLEEFKQRGQLTRIETIPQQNNKLALEEVVLDTNDVEDKDALEQFLNG